MFARALAFLLVLTAACVPALGATATYGELRCVTPDPIRSQLFANGHHTLAASLITFNPSDAIASGQLAQVTVMMVGSGDASRGNFGFYVFDAIAGSVGQFPTGLLVKPDRIVYARVGASSVTQVAILGSGKSLYKVTFNLAPTVGEFSVARGRQYFVCPWRIGSDAHNWSVARVNPSSTTNMLAVRCPDFTIPWWTGMPYPYNNAKLAMTILVTYPTPGRG